MRASTRLKKWRKYFFLYVVYHNSNRYLSPSRPGCGSAIRMPPHYSVSLNTPVVKSAAGYTLQNVLPKKIKNKLAFIPFSVNHHSLSSLPQTFSSLILPVSEEGRREEGSGRRDSSLTCFPGPCPRLCSPLIGKSGCGTHSSSTSGFIPGFYQRLDKKLHYRQSLKTLDARERHCMDDLILDIKDFFFFVLRGCQTVPLTECGKSGIGKLIR